MGFFDKIKQSLTRTTQQLSERLDEVVKRGDSAEQRNVTSIAHSLSLLMCA